MRPDAPAPPLQPSIWRGAIVLALLASICTALVAVTHRYTAPRIHANEQAYLEQSLKPVLGGIRYEKELTKSVKSIPPPHDLPGTEPATVYRVYADGKPAAALFIVTATGGFTGPIKLLIGIRIDGTTTSVKVLQHRETPGLGDMIDSSRSDWLLQFDDRSLSNPDTALWAIERDGGEFDQLTGASITPRAVVKGIRETLLYFESNRDTIFASTDSDRESQE